MKKGKEKYEKTNQAKRFIAYVIDWFIGSLVITFPLAIYYLAKTSDIEGVSLVTINLIHTLYGNKITFFIGLQSFALGLLYYVYIPYKTNGQTLGKKVMNLKIVRIDKKQLDFKTLFIRQFLVIICLETYLYTLSSIILFLLSIITAQTLLMYYYSMGTVISIISCLLVVFTKNHLAIHDYIAKTEVVGIINNKIDQKI